VTQKKSEQLEKIVIACLKASHDKTISPAKRMKLRGEAKRGRVLANRVGIDSRNNPHGGSNSLRSPRTPSSHPARFSNRSGGGTSFYIGDRAPLPGPGTDRPT
jgi:hypothetical protein